MSGIVGAELAQMLDLRRSLDERSSDVTTLMSQVRSQIDMTWWQGPASDRFREIWRGEFEPGLIRLQEALLDAAREVQTRHDAIQEATA